MRRFLFALLLALAPAPALADGGPWYSPPGAGQVPGTATNDNANAGNVGEFQSIVSDGHSATVTITIASPAVVTWTGHGLVAGNAVTFTTSGALPTGITSGTQYYVIAAGLSANAFEFSTTPFGAAVNTSGTQSGTQTGTNSITLTTTNTTYNVNAIQLTAGDWDVEGWCRFTAGGTTSTGWNCGLLTTSATQPTTYSPIITTTTGPVGVFNLGAGTTNVEAFLTGPGRLSVSGTTTLYLFGLMSFTGTAPTTYGWIKARRAR